jgi:rare lipoprotein A (peptidoglycan hydrolase)
VTNFRATCLRAFLAAGLALAASSSHPGPSRAGDLEDLRSRAQVIADQVTALEHRLAGLRAEKKRLRDGIEAADREMASLELRRNETDLAYRQALDDYVESAVAVYKSPSPSASVELILSARDMNELVAFAHLSSASAEAARESLVTLHEASTTTQTLQDQIDARKQQLLARATAIEVVSADIDATLRERREAYNRLNDRIAELKTKARREARRQPASASIGLGAAVSPDGLIADSIPPGFAGTGVSLEGIASWYGPGFEGQTTANGDIFDPDRLTAASRDLPLGSWLYVEHEGRGVVVYVNDRGPYIEGRVLDLSQAAAEAIGVTGLGWISAEVLVKL